MKFNGNTRNVKESTFMLLIFGTVPFDVFINLNVFRDLVRPTQKTLCVLHLFAHFINISSSLLLLLTPAIMFCYGVWRWDTKYTN